MACTQRRQLRDPHARSTARIPRRDLAEVRCGGQSGYNDVAVLEFRRAEARDVRDLAERIMMTAHADAEVVNKSR
jgi:hypothetical protein